MYGISNEKIAAIVLSVAVSLFSVPAQANFFAPDLEPWALWKASDENSDVSVDHSAWQYLLDEYLSADAADGINRFNYAGVSADGRRNLDAYLKSLSDTDPRNLRRAEQMPYWINLYNALTVQVVLQHYPVKTIRKINGGWFNTGPWDDSLIEVQGQELTLNDIEHRILRPIWRDPRIHYVVNCASMGCPNLAASIYTAANAESMFNQAAKNFINHSRGVAFVDGKLRLSSIYNWYDVDFGSNQAERLTHLEKYAEPELATQLAGYDGKIKYDYNWDLNQW
jgi:hypothetical protein